MNTSVALHCPSWCAVQNHHSHSLDPIDGLCSHLSDVGSLGVQVASGQRRSVTSAKEPMVVVSGLDKVTPAEARRMAQDLITAADIADGSRDASRRAVGASVTACMVDKGVTPQRLAQDILMTEGNLWRRLAGTSGFTAEDIVRLARALDVEVGVLLT